MAKNESGYEWLDDAFDDEKNAEELERAKRSNTIAAVVAGAIAVILLLIIGFGFGILALF